jgi:hypothetical protein
MYILFRETAVPKPKVRQHRSRTTAPATEWIPLPMLLILLAGAIVLIVFHALGIAAAVGSALAVAMLGAGLWKSYRQSLRAEPAPRRKARKRA